MKIFATFTATVAVVLAGAIVLYTVIAGALSELNTIFPSLG